MIKKLKNIEYISFNGCAWYLFYYMGAISALFELDPQIYKRVKIYCCSGGAMVAPILLFNLDVKAIFNQWKKIVKEKHEKEYIFSKIYIKKNCIDIFNKFYKKYIDLNILNKKMNISVSKVYFNMIFPFIHIKNKLIYKFKNKNELLYRIFQSSYIPLILGYTLLLDSHIDGGISNNKYLDKINNIKFLNFGLDSTSKILNYCDICFKNDISLNKYLTPSVDFLDTLYNSGYNDTIKYFT